MASPRPSGKRRDSWVTDAAGVPVQRAHGVGLGGLGAAVMLGLSLVKVRLVEL